MEGGQHDFKWKQSEFTKIGNKKVLRQIQNDGIKGEPLLFHIMLKQGFTWFILASNNAANTV